LIRRHLALDRLWRGSYIGVCILLAACPGHPPPLAPAGLQPADRDSAVAFAAATVPRHAAALTFKWKYRDERQSGSGRGMARLAAPDSLRIDWRAVLGMASGAAMLVGDTVKWVDPPRDSIPPVPQGVAVAWAALGVVRPPVEGARVLTLVINGGRAVVWRFASDADTLDYKMTEGPPRTLEAEWRQRGKQLVRIRTVLDPQARPASARIDSPQKSARFEFTVVAVDTAPVFPAPIWRSRR